MYSRYLLCGLIAAVLAGCATTRLPLVPIPVPIPRVSFLWDDEINLARKSWSNAAERLVEQMREEYPYTEHKALDWDALAANLIKRAEAAEETDNAAVFTAALMDFGMALNDPNLRIVGVDEDVAEPDLETGDVLAGDMLEGGVALIRVQVLAPTLGAPFPGRAFRAAIKQAVQLEARALILDLRGASAGLDEFGAEIAGYFADQPGSYRDLAYWNEESGAFEVDTAASIEVNPQTPAVQWPVVVLVDGQTRNAAEALAWHLQRQGRAQVAGATHTPGAPLLPERVVRLPEGITLSYPRARWIGPRGSLPMTPDATGRAGVQPDWLLTADEASDPVEAVRARVVATLNAEKE